MKIAFFTDTYHPQINGVVNAIDLFKKELEKRGHEIHIFSPTGNGKNIHTAYHVDFHRYPEYKISYPSFEVTRKIREIMPDVIHLHTPLNMGVAGLATAKIFNIPLVSTYHTLLNEYFKHL